MREDTTTPDKRLGLHVRKLADKSSGSREVRYDERTGAKYLYNPETEKAEKWPFAGLVVEFGPKFAEMPTRWVSRGVAEGWIEVENARVVNAPGGPPDVPWKLTHSFPLVDRIVFKTTTGDVAYKVVAQPGKFYTDGVRVEDDLDRYGEPTDVRWYYRADREDREGG